MRNNFSFIDLDSFDCVDIKIAIGHLFFKLTRHCFYVNGYSNKLKNNIVILLKKIIQKEKLFKNYKEFIFYVKLRILSDINKIFSERKFMYDYRKKIHNLFEVILYDQ